MFDRPFKDTAGNGLAAGQLIGLLDVTSLGGDDTDAKVGAIIESVVRTYETHGVAPAAVCIFPAFIGLAKNRLGDLPVKVATVAAGFPHGLSPLGPRIGEVRSCLEEGADEIDAVIRRSLALEARWQALEDETVAFRQAAGGACLKMILETSELRELSCIGKAAEVCMKAGADFVKSSTGKAANPATLEEGNAVLEAIHEFYVLCGRQAGFKAAGGIRTKADALAWIEATRVTLGSEWLKPATFRIGASSLYQALCKELTD